MLKRYLLDGKEINMTADDMSIKSNCLNIDKDGRMTLKGDETLANINIISNKDTNQYVTINPIKIVLENETTGHEIFLNNVPSGAWMQLNSGLYQISMVSNKNYNMATITAQNGNEKTSITPEEITTPKILLGNSNTIVLSSISDTNYIGTGGSYSGITTVLRGNTVRLYAHSGGGVYLGASGSTAVTSDETQKNIYEIDDKYVQFFKNLKPITYIYKNKGHRNHIGFGARQVEEALTKAGLTTEQFAGILKDKDITILADEMGTDKDVHFDELYSLRYEEFIALNTLMIQKILKKLEE